MNEEISVEAVNGAINNFVKDIHKLQEPKTPTKEQIEKIWGNHFDTTNTFILTYVDKKLIEIIINEWEKIRNKPN